MSWSRSRFGHETTRARTRVWFRLFVVSSLSCVAPALSAQPRRAMTVDDVIDLARVSAPRISPDGRRVIDTLSELGKRKDNTRLTSVSDGIANADRLAIRGWSYGGILAGWTITQTSRFKAASLGAMVADRASEYPMGFNHDVRLWYIGGTPWEAPRRIVANRRIPTSPRSRRRRCYCTASATRPTSVRA
jgi:dipeptidyl aminopeptidase/acylaminoacyl peptidase